jgi:hypothetical protein
MKHLSEEQLNEYLDHESKEREQIELHLSTCNECTTRLAALQTLFTELDSLPELILSRDLDGAVMRRVGGSSTPPKWLTLTIALQAALAVIATLVATPFIIEFTAERMPVLQRPSLTEILLQLQTLLGSWQEKFSMIHIPLLPEIPTFQISSLVILSTLAGASMVWLVGNGLLLRNQIK